MTIYPLSGASWPAKQAQSSALEEAHGSCQRKEMQMYASSCSRGSPRQWELRKIASLPAIDADYWSDASLSLPHLASALPPVEAEKERLSICRCSQSEVAPPAAVQSSYYKMSSSMDESSIINKEGRRGPFPPPLDSPALMCKERYPHLESVERVRFTSERRNGRLLVYTETAIAAQPRRRLHSQRHNGRLLLQLYVESSSTEERPLAEEEAPSAEKDTVIMKAAIAVKKASPSLQKVADQEEEEEGARVGEGGDKGNGKASIYTKVLKTLECDALINNDVSAEALSLHLNYGRRRSGVASFLHKSLTRVRPLNVLSIWQS